MQFFRDSQVPCLGLPVRLPAGFPRPKRIVNPNLLWVPRPSVPSLPPIPTCVPLLCPLQSLALARSPPPSVARNAVTERHGDGVECVMRFAVGSFGAEEATAAHFQQRTDCGAPSAAPLRWYRHNFVYCRRRRLKSWSRVSAQMPPPPPSHHSHSGPFFTSDSRAGEAL